MTDSPKVRTPQFTTTGWPWRPGNQFSLLHENEAFFAHMLAAIEQASRYVLLEMYLVSSGAITTLFLDALLRARERNVRVCVLLDGFGALNFARADRRRLLAGAVELRFYNPLRLRHGLANLRRDHRKLLLVDGELAYVGGAGLTPQFAPDYPRGPWRELMVEVRGPVVHDWRLAFERSWARCGAPAELGAAPQCAPLPQGALGRLSLSEARHHSVLANGVLRQLDRATRRVWIMSAYFVPSRRYRKALRRAARRGVDVRLLLPGSRTDHPWVRQAARRFYGKLLRSGVQIFEFQPSMLHAKMILSDDWVSVGSSNLDRWSFRWNLEANQEIASAAVAEQAAALFMQDCAASRQMSRRHWRERARLDRLREQIAGVLDRVLDSWRLP